MKRYEKMSKEEIIDAFSYSFGDCDKCQYHKICNGKGYCSESAKEWLKEEIEIKPRIATINTVEDVNKALKGFYKICNSKSCDKCSYSGSSMYGSIITCFTKYLCEEVEV